MGQFEAVVISGTIGAGKTTIAEAVSDALAPEVPHAWLELDAFAQVVPAPTGDPYNDDLAFSNLAAVWPNYVQRGVERAVIARVVTVGHQQRYEQALDGRRVAVVRLEAPANLRRARLSRRERSTAWRQHFLSRTDQLADELAAVPADLVIENTASPADVASRVLRGLGWR